MQIFTPQQEATLVEYVLSARKIDYGLTAKEVRFMASEFALNEEVPHPSSWDEADMAGTDWYYGFLQRHPELRQPDEISTQPAKKVKKDIVNDVPVHDDATIWIKDRAVCTICLDLLPKQINRNNTINCKTCEQQFHLKCVNLIGSSFTCSNCATDSDVPMKKE